MNEKKLIAHINLQEAEILKILGGSGTINPNTGLPKHKKFWKKVVEIIVPVAAIVVAVFAPELIPALGATVLDSVGIATTVGSVANYAAGAALLAGTTAELSGATTEQAAIIAAKAALSVGVGSNVSQIVGNAVAQVAPTEVSKVVASTVGAAASAAATGRDINDAMASAFIMSAGSAAYQELSAQPTEQIDTAATSGIPIQGATSEATITQIPPSLTTPNEISQYKFAVNNLSKSGEILANSFNEYNAALNEYNTAAKNYNELANSTQAKIDQYNKLVSSGTATSSQLNSLVNEINSANEQLTNLSVQLKKPEFPVDEPKTLAEKLEQQERFLDEQKARYDAIQNYYKPYVEKLQAELTAAPTQDTQVLDLIQKEAAQTVTPTVPAEQIAATTTPTTTPTTTGDSNLWSSADWSAISPEVAPAPGTEVTPVEPPAQQTVTPIPATDQQVLDLVKQQAEQTGTPTVPVSEISSAITPVETSSSFEEIGFRPRGGVSGRMEFPSAEVAPAPGTEVTPIEAPTEPTITPLSPRDQWLRDYLASPDYSLVTPTETGGEPSFRADLGDLPPEGTPIDYEDILTPTRPSEGFQPPPITPLPPEKDIGTTPIDYESILAPETSNLPGMGGGTGITTTTPEGEVIQGEDFYTPKETKYTVQKLPYWPSSGAGSQSALASTGLFYPTDSVTTGLAPVERRRKTYLDEESSEEPTGTWGSKTLRGLLGI